MATDGDVKDFLRRMREKDAPLDLATMKAADAYRAQPAFTVTETRLNPTPFKDPIKDETVPATDDGAQATGIYCDTEAAPSVGPYDGGTPTREPSTVAFTTTLTASAYVVFSDGTTGPIPADAAYQWSQISGPSVTISNATQAVATASIPSGLSVGNTQILFVCKVSATANGTPFTFTNTNFPATVYTFEGIERP